MSNFALNNTAVLAAITIGWFAHQPPEATPPLPVQGSISCHSGMLIVTDIRFSGMSGFPLEALAAFSEIACKDAPAELPALRK